MAINSSYNSSVIQRDNYASQSLPLEFLTKAMTELQQRSDRNYMAVQELPGLMNVAVDKADMQRRAQIEQGFKEKMDKMVASYNGDYSSAAKDVYNLQAEAKRLLAPSGQVGAMASNYGAIKEYQKSIFDNKALSNTEQQQAVNHFINQFRQQGGTGEVDKITGQYNQFSGERGTGFDVSKFLKDFTKIDPNSTEYNKTTYNPSTGQFMDVKTGVEINDPERIKAILKAGVYANTDFQENQKFRNTIGLKDDAVELAIAAEANARSFSKKSEDVKYRYNQKMEFDYRKARDAKKDAEEAAARQPVDTLQSRIDGMTGSAATKLTLNDFSPAQNNPSMPQSFTGYELKTNGPALPQVFNLEHPKVQSDPMLKESMLAVARKFDKLQMGNSNLYNYDMFSKGKKTAFIPIDQLSPKEQSERITKYSQLYSNNFKQAVIDDRNQTYEYEHNESQSYLPLLNNKEASNIARTIEMNKASIQGYERNGEKPLGSIQSIITDMGGQPGRISFNGKLEKEGDVRISINGASGKNGRNIMTIDVMTENGLETKRIETQGASDKLEKIYTQNVGMPFSNKDVDSDPLAGFAPTKQIATVTLRNGDQRVGLGQLKSAKRSDGSEQLYLRVNDMPNLQANTLYEMGNGRKMKLTNENVKQSMKTGQAVATILNNNGTEESVYIQVGADAIKAVAQYDERFMQNLDNKDYKNETEDFLKYK